MQTNGLKKIIVYSHDTFGLGNVRRMLAIIEHLLTSNPELSILLVSGSPMIHSFRLPEQRFDYLKLPCIGRTLSGHYIAKKLGTNFDELVAVRSQIIQAAISNFCPDVVIIDKKPRGIANELHPTLELIRNNMPATKVVLLLRDILDKPEKTRKIWQKNHYFQSIERYYHSILVMGARKVFDVCREYGLPDSSADKVEFCGYINRNQSLVFAKTDNRLLFPESDKAKVLITVGGGEDGLPTIENYLTGLKNHAGSETEAISTVIITGPEMSERHRSEIRTSSNSLVDVEIIEFTPDLGAHMQAADLIVSMAGYNTIVEILSLNKPAIVIPRVKPVQEQLMRALHMEKLGLLKCIHPDQLTPEKLMTEVLAQMAKPDIQLPADTIIDFDGLDKVSSHINSLLGHNNKLIFPNNRTQRTVNLSGIPVEGAC